MHPTHYLHTLAAVTTETAQLSGCHNTVDTIRYNTAIIELRFMMTKVFARANSGRLCSVFPSFPSSSYRHPSLFQEFHAFSRYATTRREKLQCTIAIQRRSKVDFQGKLAGHLEEIQRLYSISSIFLPLRHCALFSSWHARMFYFSFNISNIASLIRASYDIHTFIFAEST